MSYNGSGTFVVNSTGQPVVTGTVISSTAFNALTADLATGLSTAITKDGQTTTTARIVFAQGISSTLTTDATSSTTGSIITAGGISCQKALNVGTTTTLGGALTYGGVTLSNAVTGTGNMVLSASPTLTGTLAAAAANFSGKLGVGGNLSVGTAQFQVTGSAGNFYVRDNGQEAYFTLNGANYFGTVGGSSATLTLLAGASVNNVTLAASLFTHHTAINYGGVTLSNSVTGTGSMVLSAGPTFTGTVYMSGLNVGGAGTAFITAGTVVSGQDSFHGEAGNGNSVLYAGTNSTGGTFMDCRFNGTQIGSISPNGSSNTQFLTSSDVRAKTNVQDAGDAGALIDALRVRQWNWKVDGEHEPFGFIAQEEVLVYPRAVRVGDDNPETVTVSWGRDDSKLVPLLVKELQSVRARLAALEA